MCVVLGGLLAAHLVLPGNSRPPLAARENQHLVHRVHFVADVASHGDLHRHQLAEEPRVQHFPELPESPHLRREVGEVHHLVLGRGGRHLRVFALQYRICREGSEGLGWWWSFGNA